jgi:hypothetical protein
VRNIADVLSPEGVLFGGTVLGLQSNHTKPARVFLRAANKQGGFDNMDDTPEGLCSAASWRCRSATWCRRRRFCGLLCRGQATAPLLEVRQGLSPRLPWCALGDPARSLCGAHPVTAIERERATEVQIALGRPAFARRGRAALPQRQLGQTPSLRPKSSAAPIVRRQRRHCCPPRIPRYSQIALQLESMALSCSITGNLARRFAATASTLPRF